MWKGRDAFLEIKVRPLKETNLGVAQALFDPYLTHAKADNQIRATVMLIALKMLTSNAVFYNLILKSLAFRSYSTLSDACMDKNVGFPS